MPDDTVDRSRASNSFTIQARDIRDQKKYQAKSKLYCSVDVAGTFDYSLTWQYGCPVAATAVADQEEDSMACHWKRGPRAVFPPLDTDIHWVASRLIKRGEQIGE